MPHMRRVQTAEAAKLIGFQRDMVDQLISLSFKSPAQSFPGQLMGRKSVCYLQPVLAGYKSLLMPAEQY